MPLKTKPFDAAEHLKTQEDIRIFLQDAIEGTPEEFIHALSTASRAMGRRCPVQEGAQAVECQKQPQEPEGTGSPKAGDKKQQRHEKRFVERHNQIKSHPALRVYDRIGVGDGVLRIDESGCVVGESRMNQQHEGNTNARR